MWVAVLGYVQSLGVSAHVSWPLWKQVCVCVCVCVCRRGEPRTRGYIALLVHRMEMDYRRHESRHLICPFYFHSARRAVRSPSGRAGPASWSLNRMALHANRPSVRQAHCPLAAEYRRHVCRSLAPTTADTTLRRKLNNLSWLTIRRYDTIEEFNVD